MTVRSREKAAPAVPPATSAEQVQPSTLNPPPSTLNPQPSTLNPQPSTLNPQPSTLDREGSASHEEQNDGLDTGLEPMKTHKVLALSLSLMCFFFITLKPRVE